MKPLIRSPHPKYASVRGGRHRREGSSAHGLTHPNSNLKALRRRGREVRKGHAGASGVASYDAGEA